MLDLNPLSKFVAMLRQRIVAAAAALVGLTRSPMDNALSRMRDYFDVSLFKHPCSADALPLPWFRSP